MRDRKQYRHFPNRFPIRQIAVGLLCTGLLLTGCRTSTASSPAEGSDAGTTVETAAAVSASAATPVPADPFDDPFSGQVSGDSSNEPAPEDAFYAGSSQDSGSSGTEDVPPADTAQDPGTSDTGSASSVQEKEEAGFSAEGKGLVIVLDPGHSSTVPGTMEAIGPGSTELKEADTVGTYGASSATHEYELTMKVSRKLRSELEKRGYTVHLTHLDTINPISCIERAQVANDYRADAFLRIHADGSEDPETNGAMTICISEDNPYHPELYPASSRLSEVVLDTYCEQTGAKREKVWETDTMTGNNWSEVPATLIELGYMTNPDEDLKMNMDSYQKKMVQAIADGLDRWFGEMPPEELEMHPALSGGDH